MKEWTLAIFMQKKKWKIPKKIRKEISVWWTRHEDNL